MSHVVTDPSSLLLQTAWDAGTVCQASASHSRARMNDFVASHLIRKGEVRALHYIWASLRDDPLAPQVWIRALQAGFLKLRPQGAASGSVV
ncbi:MULTISPECIES: hypothetical protein [Aphanothece]|uniref:hypothetical protein n=1 Tax=Aphanothece TaxID=1121 RepID=UPI0039854F46